MMSPGSLLSRNKKLGIDVVVIQREEDEETIPKWLIEKPTPWNLVAFFEQCLNKLVMEGKPRRLVGDYRRELKPAKKLLENGIEEAARICILTAKETYGPVTLYRALERVES